MQRCIDCSQAISLSLINSYNALISMCVCFLPGRTSVSPSGGRLTKTNSTMQPQLSSFMECPKISALCRLKHPGLCTHSQTGARVPLQANVRKLPELLKSSKNQINYGHSCKGEPGVGINAMIPYQEDSLNSLVRVRG